MDDSFLVFARLTDTSDIVSESLSPERKTKAELEQMVKANGGKFYQTYDAVPNTICISDRGLHHGQSYRRC